MKLKRLKISNFMGIASADLDLEARGLVMIEGVNEASATASSNGAGKSTIFEAIFWALYGKTKRGLTADDVVNRDAGKDCWVELEFDSYMVRRFRKCADGSGLNFYQRVDGGYWFDLTKGTVKDTQALIESVVGLSELTFSKVAYFGQGDLKDFAALSDAELKQVFEQGLGINYLTEYLTKAKDYKAAQQREALMIAGEKEALEREAAFVRDSIDKLEGIERERRAKYEREMDGLNRRLAEVEAEVKRRHDATTTDGLTHEEADRRIVALMEQLERRERVFEARKAAETSYRDAYKRHCSDVALLKTRQDEVVRRLAELKELDEKVGTDCGECGREFTLADIETYKKQAADNIRAIGADVAKLKERVAAGEASTAEAKAILDRLDIECERLREVEREVERLESDKKVFAEYHRYTERLVEERARLVEAIDKLAGELSKPFSVNTADELARLSDITGRLSELTARLSELQAEVDTATQLCEILGNQGLKSYIFDGITPELNRLANEYLSVLNPDMTVDISTVSKLKGKDEYREKFGIKIDNAHGSDSFNGSSGGERQTINLAIALAFNKVVRAMSGKAVNVLFLDEPLESLDESASERALEVCSRFASEVPSVFIISHNPAIRDMVANTVRVVKRGGGAVVL